MKEASIESILFINNKPISYKKLGQITGLDTGEVKDIINSLKNKYNIKSSGIKLVESGQNIQFVTSPDSKAVVEEFLNDELTGDMTKPQLETLTVIAYRGPILKSELEQIRGVNCSLILRNLLIRGLVEIDESGSQSKYQITIDFLKFLGLNSTYELPDYERLSRHENISTLLDDSKLSDSN